MSNLLSYSSYFASFLINELNNLNNIKSIILFGSVARGEANKESDVDIFIDLIKNTKKQVQELRKILEDFYKSRDALLFKNKGIDNKINLSIGKIEEWKSLEKSIENTGIVLYGNYISSNFKGKKYVIFSWDNIGKNRGAFLNKIYGFRIKDKSYKGLIEKFNGKKIGKSSVLIPVEYRKQIEVLLKDYRVNAKVLEVYF